MGKGPVNRPRGAAGARRVGPRPGRALGLVLILLIVGGALLSGWRPTPAAAGPTDLNVAVAAGDPLIGGPISYTITIENTQYVSSPENKAYNLTLENILPAGVSFVSATPNIAPSISLVSGGTRQKLVFENISDDARNQTITFTINATLAPGALPGVTAPGTSLTDDVTVKATDNPRADAAVIAGTASVTSTALPFKLAKATAQSTAVNQATGACNAAHTPEDRRFDYTLTATNNPIGATDAAVVTETLPYGVDYCGTTTFSVAGPTATVTYNADGTTTIVYALGTLAAGQVVTITPRVAIPYTYATSRPGGLTLTGANTGGLAGQLVADDTTFINRARMSGTYALVGYQTGEKTSTVKAKYATVKKTDDRSVVVYGDKVNYTLTVSSSEHYTASNIYLIDTVPNGEDYDLGTASLTPTGDAAANGVYTPCAGADTSLGAGIYLCPDGTTVLTWGPLYTAPVMGEATSFDVTLRTTVRTTYRVATDPPIVAGDSLTNRVRLVYDAANIAAYSAPPNSIVRDEDNASSGHTTIEPTLTKSIVAVTRGDGSPTPVGEGRVINPKSAVAAVGDIVTFRLDYDASAIGTDQKNIYITDFLPDGYQYIPGSVAYGGIPGFAAYTGTINGAAQGAGSPDPECDPGCAPSSVLAFRLTGTALNPNITPKYTTLRIEFKARVTGSFGARANLGKFSGTSTSGAAYSGRDSASVADLAPNLTVAKTNTATNPAFGNNTFDYTVTITNTGTSTAYQISDLIDTLPADIKYTGTISVDPPGSLTFVSYTGGDAGGFGGTLRYTVNTPIGKTAPNNFIRLKYGALIQPAPAVGATRTNTAQIDAYNSQPATAPAGSGAAYGPVSGTSNVRIGGDVLTKTAAVIEPRANGAGGRITIGDQVRYTLTYNIPGNTTIYEGQLRDCLPLGFRYVPGSYAGSVAFGTLPNPANFALLDTHPNFSVGNGTDGCPADQELVIIPVGTQTNTATAITLQAQLTAVITGKDRSGTPKFTTYPGPNNTRSNGTTPNANYAYVYARPTASGTLTQLAATNVPNNGADNNVYIPRLTLSKAVARTSNPATITNSVPAPAYPLLREGGTVDFLLRLQNGGGSTAYEIANLVDSFDAPLAYVQAYQSGASCDTAIALPAGDVTVSGQAVSIRAPASLAEGQSYYVCLRAQLNAPTTVSTLYNNNLQLGSGVGIKYSSAPASLPVPPADTRTFPDRAGYTQDQIASATVRTPDVITFGPLANKVYGNAPIPLAATSSGGRPIDYSATGTCTLTGTAPNQSVRITGAGTCNVKASQRGENLADDVTQSFTIARAPLTVKVNDLTVPFGAPISSACTLAAGYPQPFVYGETVASLGGALTCTTDAPAGGEPGLYTLIPSGYTSNNYIITYLNAQVRITACQVTLGITMLPAGTIQYSDRLVLRARVTVCGGNVLPTGNVQFLLDGAILGGVAIDSNGLAELPVQMLRNVGGYNVTARYTSTDSRFLSANGGPAPLTVTREDASARYTGKSSFVINNATKRATVQLIAEIKDITAVNSASDPNAGDVRTARVRFVDTATGQVVNSACDNLAVALVTTADTKVGTANCTFQSPAATYNLRIEVYGNYTGSATVTPAIVVGTGGASSGTVASAQPGEIGAIRREDA